MNTDTRKLTVHLDWALVWRMGMETKKKKMEERLGPSGYWSRAFRSQENPWGSNVMFLCQPCGRHNRRMDSETERTSRSYHAFKWAGSKPTLNLPSIRDQWYQEPSHHDSSYWGERLRLPPCFANAIRHSVRNATYVKRYSVRLPQLHLRIKCLVVLKSELIEQCIH